MCWPVLPRWAARFGAAGLAAQLGPPLFPWSRRRHRPCGFGLVMCLGMQCRRSGILRWDDAICVFRWRWAGQTRLADRSPEGDVAKVLRWRDDASQSGPTRKPLLTRPSHVRKASTGCFHPELAEFACGRAVPRHGGEGTLKQELEVVFIARAMRVTQTQVHAVQRGRRMMVNSPVPPQDGTSTSHRAMIHWILFVCVPLSISHAYLPRGAWTARTAARGEQSLARSVGSAKYAF